MGNGVFAKVCYTICILGGQIGNVKNDHFVFMSFCYRYVSGFFVEHYQLIVTVVRMRSTVNTIIMGANVELSKRIECELHL